MLALPRDPLALRAMADQVFSRTASAPLVSGNATRVLRDATENYPAWSEAIASAKTSVHVEMYIVHRDDVGRHFVAELTAKARQGVAVRVIYDWFGCGCQGGADAPLPAMAFAWIVGAVILRRRRRAR